MRADPGQFPGLVEEIRPRPRKLSARQIILPSKTLGARFSWKSRNWTGQAVNGRFSEKESEIFLKSP